MKTLILMRHAKAKQLSDDLTDRHRSLQLCGLQDAKKSGRIFAKLKVDIDELITSPANRAVETACAIKHEMGKWIQSWSVEERIYSSDVKTLLQVIQQVDQKKKSVMLIGHNPELDVLAEYFLAKPFHFKTGASLLLKFDVKTWDELANAKPVEVSLPTEKPA